MNAAFKYLVLLTAICLLAGPTLTSAAAVKTKKQAFKVDPTKKSFIDFGAFNNKIKSPKTNKSSKKFGVVDFKPKSKKKSSAVFDFSAPTPNPTGAQNHVVSVELLSMSLVSTAPVSLDPFLGAGSGKTGIISLNLSTPAFNGAGLATLNSKNKKKGKLDFKLSKFFDVSTVKVPPTGGLTKKKKTKSLKALDLGATGVPFSQQSPITVTAPFCLESGANASICLAPLSAVPTPNSYSLVGIGFAAFALLALFRRRWFASNGRVLLRA